MDPLTHTLVGANLAATRLGARSRYGAAALVIGANLPDIDAIFYFTGHSDFALGFRRGWTHGILALAVLPFILAGILLLWDQWRRPDARAPVDGKWLLLLSALAILTHPALDWLNNYGMRWLMPFRGTWTYGDSVFIMDPWLWLVLGGGWLAGRPPNKRLVALWAFFAFAIGWVVAQRTPRHLVVVAIVALVLLLALLWRAPRELSSAALILSVLYMGGRLAMNEMTERAVRRESAGHGITGIRRLMASPHPLDPRRWDVVIQTPEVYRYGTYRWGGGLVLAQHRIPLPHDSPEWRAARSHPSVRGFMTWTRFPWYEVERVGGQTRVYIHDARYARKRTTDGFGGVTVTLP